MMKRPATRCALALRVLVAIPRTTNVGRIPQVALVGALVLASSLASAADCPVIEKATKPSPYTVTCSGQANCAATDTLTIAPMAGAASPLAAVCLKVGRGSSPTLLGADVPQDDKPTAAKLALLPLLKGRLDDETAGRTDRTLTSALLGSASTIGLEVVLQDKQGNGQAVPVDVDPGEFWRTRRLKLAVDDAHCFKSCALGSHLQVRARGFGAWRAATKKDMSKVTVLINDVRFPGLLSVLGSTDDDLDFLLARDMGKPESANAWDALLQKVDAQTNKAQGAKIALADDEGIISNALDSRVVIETGSRGLFAAILLIVAVALLVAGQRANRLAAIRDDAPPQAPRLNSEMPFSLGRTQMLLWTITVVGIWLFVGLSLGDWSGPNATALILMGISGGTLLGAAVAVDSPPAVDAAAQQSLTDLDAAETALKTQPNDAAQLNTRSTAIKQLRQAGLWSKNLFADLTSPIASDKSALHRLQIVTFTIVIWIYYLLKAWQTRAMPDLTDAQLALLGISGGTYVGFKMVKEG